MTDFETGAEPDVLFSSTVWFNPFVKAGKVVSIDEIREVYPDYASNMKDSMLGASPVDGKIIRYRKRILGRAVCQQKVLDEAGVAVPGADYTWNNS